MISVSSPSKRRKVSRTPSLNEMGGMEMEVVTAFEERPVGDLLPIYDADGKGIDAVFLQ